MKLVSSGTSPYAQKVRVTAIEKKIDLEIENVVPTGENSIAVIKNPLGRVPTLILDSGELIFDSPVICAYLDTLTHAPILLPRDLNERWQIERIQALADGIMDSAFSIVMERKRTDTAPSEFWLNRWQLAIERSVAYMAELYDDQNQTFHLGTIACVCALNYLNFRLPEITWSAIHPGLGEWHQRQLARESFKLTALG